MHRIGFAHLKFFMCVRAWLQQQNVMYAFSIPLHIACSLWAMLIMHRSGSNPTEHSAFNAAFTKCSLLLPCTLTLQAIQAVGLNSQRYLLISKVHDLTILKLLKAFCIPQLHEYIICTSSYFSLMSRLYVRQGGLLSAGETYGWRTAESRSRAAVSSHHHSQTGSWQKRDAWYAVPQPTTRHMLSTAFSNW